MKDLSTEYLLSQWGIWVRCQTGVPKYVSPSYALMRDKMGSIGGEVPQIQEETAMMIDRLVCRMALRYHEAAYALFLWYRHSMTSYRQLGRAMGVHHNKAEMFLAAGIAWVDAMLCSYAEAA
jgi:hypothetical protein